MDLSQHPTSEQSYTRRTVVTAAGTTMFVGNAGTVSATSEQVTPTMIIPAVDEFENNYVGQFLTIRGQSSGKGQTEAVKDACTELPWPPEEMIQRARQLTDRRSEEPIAVRLPVFLRESQRPEQDDALFIISRAKPCNGQYVQVQLSPIDLRSITGGESGPDVTEEDDGSGLSAQDGTGFGLLAGTVGGIGAILAHHFVKRDSSSD